MLKVTLLVIPIKQGSPPKENLSTKAVKSDQGQQHIDNLNIIYNIFLTYKTVILINPNFME